ncbi:hypothetical protein E3T54_02830 [Cryobacterium sp. Sr8]|uniref:hypothetical protein n=1 Tax=Cryobacterium sp. Sr8 TaxID=1259203 RepID=UPI00106C1E1D|nr:hypothetical protein [Cryobacterium sp. Sr8]TFD80693.1 hypothetical protein E3T54_02830 [Cryobacterium sp. Sr8]
MSKFNIGDRVRIHGEPTDWDMGTIVENRSSFGEDYYNVQWDSTGLAGCYEEDLFLVCAVTDRPNFTAPKHAAAVALHRVDAQYLTPHQAVTLASKLLQFATQEGTK